MSSSEQAVGAAGGSNILHRIDWKKAGLPIAIILLSIFFFFMNSNFFSFANLTTLGRQIAVLAIVCAGQTMVMISGGIDLSNEAVMSMVSVFSATMMVAYGVPVGIILSIIAGVLMTSSQGFLFAKFGIPAFIVTLGGQQFFRGWTFVYSNGQPIVGIDPIFSFLGQGSIAGLPVPAIIAVLVYVLCYFIMTKTRMGRYLYAIGGNTEAAVLSGVDAVKYRLFAFMLSGGLIALASLILTSRVLSGQPTLATGFALQSIAAVVIGGTSLRGGEGSIVQTALGVILVGIIGNGLNLMRVSSFIQMMVIGSIIVLAVWLDVRQKRAKA